MDNKDLKNKLVSFTEKYRMKEDYVNIEFEDNRRGYFVLENFLFLIKKISKKSNRVNYNVKNSVFFIIGEEKNKDIFYNENNTLTLTFLNKLNDINIIFTDCEFIFLNQVFCSIFEINMTNYVFMGKTKFEFYNLRDDSDKELEKDYMYKINKLKEFKSFELEEIYNEAFMIYSMFKLDDFNKVFSIYIPSEISLNLSYFFFNNIMDIEDFITNSKIIFLEEINDKINQNLIKIESLINVNVIDDFVFFNNAFFLETIVENSEDKETYKQLAEFLNDTYIK